MTNNTPKDSLGRTIQVGDVLTYPVRKGSWMEMKCGVVSKLEVKKDWRDREHVEVTLLKYLTRWETKPTVTITRLDRTTILDLSVPKEDNATINSLIELQRKVYLNRT